MQMEPNSQAAYNPNPIPDTWYQTHHMPIPTEQEPGPRPSDKILASPNIAQSQKVPLGGSGTGAWNQILRKYTYVGRGSLYPYQ